jgi:hypothetical protein
VPARVDAERRLVDDGPPNRDSGGGRAQRQDAAGGHPEHMGRPARRLDERVEVLDLALDRVARRVAAVAAPAAVVADHAEPRREQPAELSPALPAAIAERAADEDQRRPVAGAVVGDRRAVGRADGRVAAHAAAGR